MMEALGRWLLAVSAAALLVSVVQALIPEGGLRRTATFIGGLLLLAVLLRPAAELDLSGLSAGLSDWTDAVVFAVLIVVLLVRPTGFLGRSMTEKV